MLASANDVVQVLRVRHRGSALAASLGTIGGFFGGVFLAEANANCPRGVSERTDCGSAAVQWSLVIATPVAGGWAAYRATSRERLEVIFLAAPTP